MYRVFFFFFNCTMGCLTSQLYLSLCCFLSVPLIENMCMKAIEQKFDNFLYLCLCH